MNFYQRIIIFAALSAPTLAGCGEDWQADTYPATGRISINGKPPAGALVQLFPTGATKPDERNSRPWGLVQEDGSYTLSTYDGAPGAPAGDYLLTLTWPPDASIPSMADRLKSKYARPDQSQWKVTVKKGENVLPPVELTNVDVDMKAGASPAKALAGPMTTGVPPKGVKGGRK